MRWQDGDRGGNIEDRRGLHPVAAGGIGVGGLVLAAIGLSLVAIVTVTVVAVRSLV